MSQLLRNIGLMRFLSKLWMPIADEVVIIGGGLVGLELAEYLAERRRRVTVLEPGPDLGAELAIVRRARVLYQLEAQGATVHKAVDRIDIGPDAVRFELAGAAQTLPCKQVIIALGAQPDDRLLRQLAGSGARLHQIGDCRRVGYIDGAILDARELVQEIGRDCGRATAVA
jgi:2,4-dienoyl-CoA reductase (NADPH2)